MSLQVIDAVGSPRQLGQAHGEQARDLIAQSLDGWREAMARQGRVPADLVQELAQTSGLAAALRQHLPWLSDEIAGIAEGANASVDDVFALNCLDEAWWWGQPGPGCSVIALGATSSGSAICGQTMDLDPWMDGTQIALAISTRRCASTGLAQPRRDDRSLRCERSWRRRVGQHTVATPGLPRRGIRRRSDAGSDRE